jgi:CubicO group peptidase (beta-lactamase class C family)
MLHVTCIRYAARLVALLLCALPGALMSTAVGAEGAMDRESMEALYLERFESLRDRSSRNGLQRYDPLVPVPGSPAWQPLPVRPAAERRLSPDVLEAATDYAAANRSSALLIWVDGALELAAYFGDAGPGTPIVGKSLAKPLSVIAVGRAMQRGFIASLEQSAADFIAAWRGDPRAAITLRMLLGNRSGLLPQAPAPEPDNVLNRAYLHPAHDRVIIEEYPLVHPPGSRYEYANANSELVAPIIERATGQPYHRWLSEALLQPLGAPGGEIWLNRPGGTAHSGCCVLLPPESFLRLGLLLLDDGVWRGQRLLPEGFVDAMRSASAENRHAGLGVYLGTPYAERRGPLNPERDIGRVYHSEPYLADDLFLFDGNSNQVVYIIPSRRVVILRTGAWAPQDPEWDNALLPNLVLRGLGAGAD